MSSTTRIPLQQQDALIGFGDLPTRIYRKISKCVFEFTLMVVGESGLGKATLIDSLFLSDLYPQRRIRSAYGKLCSSVQIESSTVDIEERGVKVRLTIIDTPGYGDSLDNSDSCQSIVNYIDEQFKRFYDDENSLHRRTITDHRVHCLLYFISPFARGLKPLDVQCLRALQERVNVIPVIAKADALTSTELLQMKQTIREQMTSHGIQLYHIPACDPEDHRQWKLAFPLAIVSSARTIQIQGRPVRARLYPWGWIDTENSQHCDLKKLRNLLVTHLQDLQEGTHDIHYERYRRRKVHSENYQRQHALLQEKDDQLRRMTLKLANLQAQLTERCP